MSFQHETVRKNQTLTVIKAKKNKKKKHQKICNFVVLYYFLLKNWHKLGSFMIFIQIFVVLAFLVSHGWKKINGAFGGIVS